MWGHSSAGTVQAKLLKTLIRFRKQTNCSSYQQSFILSARGMPLQRGLGTGHGAAVETRASTLDLPCGVWTARSFPPTEAEKCRAALFLEEEPRGSPANN